MAPSIWETPPMTWSDLPGVAALLDFVCPPRCAFCGADMPAASAGVMACGPCMDTVGGDPPRCATCGHPTATCRCAGDCPDWDGIVVLAGYGVPEIRDAVLRAKRPGGEQVAAALAALLVTKHRAVLAAWRVDVVAPVPMHWRRRLTRGTSAAAHLATGVARWLGLPRRGLVRRRRATPMQNELPFEERRGNVRGAFTASRRSAGRRVLLVDDVTTTGATLAECRRALVEAGAVAVYAAVAARADRGGSGTLQ